MTSYFICKVTCCKPINLIRNCLLTLLCCLNQDKRIIQKWKNIEKTHVNTKTLSKTAIKDSNSDTSQSNESFMIALLLSSYIWLVNVNKHETKY